MEAKDEDGEKKYRRKVCRGSKKEKELGDRERRTSEKRGKETGLKGETRG